MLRTAELHHVAFGSIAQVIEPNVDVDGNGIVAENVIIETKY